MLNGAKMWITNGSQATVSIIWAKTGAIDDSKSIRGFIVPTDTKGYTARDQKGSSPFARRTPARSRSRTAWCRRMRSCPRAVASGPLMCLTQARYGIAWGAVGAAMACFVEAVSYAKNRIMFDQPDRADPDPAGAARRHAHGDHQAQLLALQLGRLKDAGTFTPAQVSLAKRNNVNMACECAREARRLLGGNGILVEYHSMRHHGEPRVGVHVRKDA